MKGYVLLADGMRLDGELVGPGHIATGWLAANTAVVGFQEMLTDAAYKGRILAFTYPEIGNIGAVAAFSESCRVQVAGVVVKVLSEYRSHYLSEEDLSTLLARDQVPCLTDVDTRALAVHLREHGEMPAAIAPATENQQELREKLAGMNRPAFAPSEPPPQPAGGSGPPVAVVDLGVRRSVLWQLSACCRPALFPYDVDARALLAEKPAGIFVSDGPGNVLPPDQTVEMLRAALGQVPILACGLGHVALGLALGGRATFLKRGHHGANCPVRDLSNGRVSVTQQRHSVALERESVLGNPQVQLAWEHLNDGSVEGIRSTEGSAIGLQMLLAASEPGLVNEHIQQFVKGLTEREAAAAPRPS